ncbi:transmembrane transport protein [Streptomyces aidingensis]|uniref:Transmembrane transport protein n=1 Tax=Streptomyces aidingensis TaxID=910347 RepID=A0A1I1LFX9_9ACTN|nr:transmembrane transport protein [Streptomyces aidingensis]SFC71432.1 hypothetical protein SAMN05421773_105185 [Streptomyces aidingensis]
MTAHHHDDAAPERLRLERVLAREISLRSRLRYVAVGLAGFCGALFLALLWATEPEPLPARTGAAFAGLIAIGLGWAGLAGWVLSRRRPLFAADRVLAARLALGACVLTGAGGVLLAAVRSTPGVVLGTGLAGAVLIGLAVLGLARATARRRELLRLRTSLGRAGDRP